ncbi:MAG TPA: alpha/beta hydrolase [Solirubrobacteraceae bacterium]|jgi:acetyl esterase|nr:alpha/beta hydrolase [Solirubrobacteraceae bacterium]
MTPQLDPQAQALLEVMGAIGTPQPYEVSVAQARESMRSALIAKGEPIALHSVQEISLPTAGGKLSMRLYRPGTGALPIALFLHGGGWTLNDLDTHDRLCRRIASRSGWMLASLDYRRAPEHRHPAALEDAHLAYRWLLDNATHLEGDPSRVALVGESSGATTAACLSLLLRDLGAPLPCYQVLAYPVTGMYRHWPSYEERGTGYTLDLELARWFLRNYLPADQALEDPYLMPLAAPDLGGLEPTLVMTAEFDPLRDEGIAYAQRLAAAGVMVEHVHVEDQMHGFLLLDRAVARAGELIDRLADALSARPPRSLRAGSVPQASAVTAGAASRTLS